MNGWFNTEVSVGNIVTALSVVVSAIALLITLNKDRQLRKKEYADRIRNAAGAVTAKLERRKEIFLSFFDSIQPLITDADIKLVKEQDVIAARDFLWRELGLAHAKCLERITDEGIEVAYKDLYGYDPDIQELFGKAIGELKKIEGAVSRAVLHRTQAAVMELEGLKGPRVSAELGNALRDTCCGLAQEAERLIDEVLTPFQGQMIDLIRAQDGEIVNRRIRIGSAGEMFLRATELTVLFEKSNARVIIGTRNTDCLMPINYISMPYGSILRAEPPAGGVVGVVRKGAAYSLNDLSEARKLLQVAKSRASHIGPDAPQSSPPASEAESINIKDIIETVNRESRSQTKARVGSSVDLMHQPDSHKTVDHRRHTRSQSDSYRKR